MKSPLFIVIFIFEMLLPVSAQNLVAVKNPYQQKVFSIGIHNHLIGLDETRKDYIASITFSDRIGKYYRLEPEAG